MTINPHHDWQESAAPADPGLVIDCDCCAMRGTSACDDCVVSFLLTGEPQPVQLSAAEFSALDALAGEGLVPRLRLIPRERGLDAGAV